MKTKPSKDFETFQREFKKWQKIFGLNGYQVYFEHKPLSGSLACVEVRQEEMCATVTLDNNRAKPVKSRIADPPVTVAELAKHEALHLLTMRLQCLAGKRYLREGEIEEASEELTVKLERLIE